MAAILSRGQWVNQGQQNMVPTPLGRPKIRTFPGPFQDLGQIYKDLQLTYDS